MWSLACCLIVLVARGHGADGLISEKSLPTTTMQNSSMDNSKEASCDQNQFLSNEDRCLDCHCNIRCNCSSETNGCLCSPSDVSTSLCETGYTDYPTCQRAIGPFEPSDLLFKPLNSSAVQFQIRKKGLLPSGIYRIQCISNGSQPVYVPEIRSDGGNSTHTEVVTKNGFNQSIAYACRYRLEVDKDRLEVYKGKDRSEYTSPVNVCTVPSDPKASDIRIRELLDTVRKTLDLKVSWPLIEQDCHGPSKEIIINLYKLNGEHRELNSTDSVTAKKTLFTFSTVQFDTAYYVAISIPSNVSNRTVASKSFTTRPLVLSYLANENLRLTPNYTSVDVAFSTQGLKWNGTFPPDRYILQYQLLGQSQDFNITFTRSTNFTQRVNIPGGPGSKFKLRVISVTSIYGVEQQNSSSQFREVSVLSCSEPSKPTITNTMFNTDPDIVDLEVLYEPSIANCYGGVTYKVIFRKDDEYVRKETSCNSETSCTVPNLDAFSAYTVSVRAENEANKTIESDTMTIETPERAPFPPRNVAFNVTGRDVVITWDAPAVNRGKIRWYRVHISDEDGSAGTFINTTNLTYTFKGEWEFKYYVSVQGYTIAYGQTSPESPVDIPSTIPSEPTSVEIQAINESCVHVEWSRPSEPGGHITGYKVECKLLEWYNDSIQQHAITSVPYDTGHPTLLRRTVCSLHEGSLYNCSVCATTSAGYGFPRSVAIWTHPSSPHPPSLPKLIAEKSTDSSLTFFLPRADKRDYPTSAYYVGVQQITKSKRSSSLTLKNFSSESTVMTARCLSASLSEDDVGREFTIGDGLWYGGYYNAPLAKGASYKVFYGVEVKRGEISKERFVELPELFVVAQHVETADVHTALIASVCSVSIIIIAIISVAVTLFVLKRKRFTFSRRPTLRAELVPLRSTGRSKSPDTESGNGAPLPEIRPIKLPHLHTYVYSHEDEIRKQYCALPSGFLAPVSSASEPANKEKNRFANILPYDHSRVKLRTTDDDSQSDYINASYIDGYKQIKQYIAAQGPTKSTCGHFWRMVWENKVTCIVMVTKLIEEGKLKCEQYWPDDKESLEYEDLTITSTSEENWADFSMKTFRISKAGETDFLTCHHMHFLSWPDHGTPKHSTPFLLFRRKVKAFSGYNAGPLVVHCSAGVGRTGTFIAIDYLLDQAAAENQVHVFNCVQLMRNQRVSMVQTADQYVYIYQAVCEATSTDRFSCPAPDYQKDFAALAETLGEEFDTLCRLTIAPEEENFQTGKEKENKSKNQNPNILPHDGFRAYISSQVKGCANYINAVFVNGYRNKDFFVATQVPFPYTVDDFLRLVYDQELTAVVTLEADLSDIKRFGTFLPADCTIPLETELFTVTMTDINDERADIIVRELTLHFKAGRTQRPHSFKHFQANFWHAEIPEYPETFITLLEQIDKWQQVSTKSVVCVQCRDGNERTGLLISVWNALDRLKTEQEIDAYHTVELIRMVRPQFITSVDQYKFLYEVLYTYLQEFDLYANYK